MKPLSAKLRAKAQRIKLVLLDVDGVLTDGGIILDDRGRELKRFDVRDGQGIRLLIGAGIQVGLITGRSSRAVDRRARELGIGIVYQNTHNKIEAYRKIQKRTGFRDREIAYVGDDLPDLAILREVGFAVVVQDSWAGLRRAADYITQLPGGRGAVREVVELLLQAQKKWDKLTEKYLE